MSERLSMPLSDAEMERRWTAIRSAMEDAGVDVLLMQNNNDHMGGYCKYFTDIPATNGYPQTVVFPRDDAMTLIHQGPFGGDREIPVEGDGIHRGIKRLMTTPSFASAPFTADYDPELAAKALEPYQGGTIGLLGTYQMSFAMVDYLKRGNFSNTNFVDFSDAVDRIKVIKSPEEKERVRGCAAQQVEAMKAAIEAIEPGMRDSDVAAVARHKGENLASEQGIYLCSSAPLGTPAPIGPRHNQNRVIQKGDVFSLLVENNGHGGFFTEIGRTIVLGKASQEMKDNLELVLEAQKHTLGRLKPGADCKEIWDAHNEWLEERGKPKESRLYCHGQGYDLVERPLVRFDEPLKIQKDMNLVCHPGWVGDGAFNWICDNYIIGDGGPGASIHEFPQEIIEVDV